ncbi:uncharacterized protein LOC108950170 [Ciona intestinalis]
MVMGKGSFEVYSFSSKSKGVAEILYQICLTATPANVYATAKPSNPSLPHKFSVTILEIKKTTFMIELERIDKAAGWETRITVEWYLLPKNTDTAMVYRNSVLWFPAPSQVLGMVYKTASKYCTDRGGRLVDIVDKAMYDVVYEFAQQNIVFGSRPFVYTWLGSTYNTSANTVTRSNGEPGYNGDWWPEGSPTSSASHTGLVLYIVPPTSNSTHHGMLNHHPNVGHNVAQICESL